MSSMIRSIFRDPLSELYGRRKSELPRACQREKKVQYTVDEKLAFKKMQKRQKAGGR